MQLGCLPTEQHTLNTTRNELILKKSGDNRSCVFFTDFEIRCSGG